ncbi:MAG: prolyl oligopeptidase family serine peptidase [Actinobacteria bacterium]|nr:prolyl oligopeptidase family serine peptidase [Actinomycetota bacterium]
MLRPRPDRRALPVLALVVASALLAGGCAGSDSEGSSPTTAGASGDSSTTIAEATTTTVDPTAAPAGEVATAEPIPSDGCGRSTVTAGTEQKQDLPESGRWYLLTTPPEHDGETPLPLVIDYHGLSEGAEIHATFSQFGAYAAEHGFVVVQPNGTGEPVGWNVGLDPETNPDLVFTQDLLSQLETDLCIDTSRIYATGLSNGAMMSSTLACTMADRFAAVAPVAGIMRADGCDPSRPVPVLTMHGTDDPILYFNGGVGDRLGNVLEAAPGSATTEPEAAIPPADLDGPGYPAAAKAWAEGNGCTGDPVDTELTPSITQRTWDCPAEAPVEFLVVQGGGHSWPGSEFGKAAESIVGPTDMSIDATEVIWQFFQRFALPPA